MTDVGPSFILHACSLRLVNTEDIQSKQNDGMGSKKDVISCAHRACMVVYYQLATHVSQ